MTKPKQPFAYLPRDVVESQAYVSLRARSAILLSLIAARYNGYNNGDLAITYNEMQARWGWRRAAVSRSLFELIEHGLIVRTRAGGRNLCSLYALGWLPVKDKRVIAKLHKTGGEAPQSLTNGWQKWHLRCVS